MMRKKNKDKVEVANKIAKQSQRVSVGYELVEVWVIKTFRVFSSYIDKWIFSSRNLLVVSLLLALILFISTYYTENSSFLTKPLNNEKTISDVEVVAKYNSDTFELLGLPKSMDVSLIGTTSNVISASNKQGRVIADLSGYTEGTHTVTLKTDGYGTNVESIPSDKEVTITLKKKTTRSFPIEYDFINLYKLDGMFVLEEPTFDMSSVMVRGSQDTLDTIAFVKVLIDVQGKEEDFTQDAPLIAYDTTGKPVDADIIPSTIKTSVTIKTPSNTVPIVLETSGDLPDGLAIETITMDHTTIQLYASEAILSEVEFIPIKLDLSTISENSEIFVPIILPNGVSSPISRINLNLTLNKEVSKTFDDVVINYRNNINNYDDLVTSFTTIAVTVSGTQNNIDLVKVTDFDLYFDMINAKVGTTEEYPLLVEVLNNDLYINVVPNVSSIEVTILNTEGSE